MQELGSLHDVLRRGGIRAVYQPIVELVSGRTVAFEALARGPAGSRFESPLALIEAAEREGLSVELDWECRAAAIRGALDGGVPRPLAVFVNAEPVAIATPVPHT